jgi:hypothetical protein
MARFLTQANPVQVLLDRLCRSEIAPLATVDTAAIIPRARLVARSAPNFELAQSCSYDQRIIAWRGRSHYAAQTFWKTRSKSAMQQGSPPRRELFLERYDAPIWRNGAFRCSLVTAWRYPVLDHRRAAGAAHHGPNAATLSLAEVAIAIWVDLSATQVECG